MTRRGFSMLELVITVVMLAFLLGLAVLSFRGGISRASSRALAERVAGELKVARQLAISRKEPVAVVFPSSAGSLPHSQSLYLLSGNENPRILRVQNFASEMPDVYIYIGHWALASGTNAPGRSSLSSNAETGFSLSDWNHPRPGDHTFVFTPSGGVVSDRVAFDQAYHILICEGASWAPASVGSTASFALSQVFAPQTVTLTSAGEISVTPGLVGSNASQVLAQSTLAMPAPAPPPAMPALGNTPPGVAIQFYPQPNSTTLPPGADATVDLEEGHLTLVAEVHDAEGDRVRLNWTSDRGGAFSSTAVDMEWDQTLNGGAGAWRSIWTWVPPPAPALAPGDVVTLTCTVTDERGASSTATLGAAGKVELTRLGKIAFDSTRDGGAPQLYVMNGDGTNQRRITGNEGQFGCYFARPRFSPDGRKLVAESCFLGAGNLVVLNEDGTGLRRLTDVNGSGAWATITECVSPSWSADGTRISFLGRTGGGWHSYWINSDGSKPSNPSLLEPDQLGSTFLPGQQGTTGWRPDDLTSPTAGFVVNFPSAGNQQLFERRLDGTALPLTASGWDHNDAACSPDGTRLAFESTESANRDIWVADYAPGALGARTNLTADAFSDWAPTWSPNGSKIAFASDRSGASHIFIMNNDGTQVQRLTNSAGVNKNPCWAP